MNNFDIFKQIETAPFEDGFSDSGEAVIDRRHKRVIDAVKNHGHILEVGPGNGKLGVYFLSQHRPYSMVDIERAKLFSFYEHIGTEMAVPSYVFKDKWEWSLLPSGAFCSVIAAEVIEHVDDYKWMVNEMIRLSMGNVIITTPRGKSYFTSDHLHFFTEEDFKFIEKPYTIETVTTKASDEEDGSRCLFIVIDAR